MFRFLLFLASLGAVAIPLVAAPAAQSARVPNFLILLADDMGFSDAGCYGGEISTPNLDRLAQEGVRFTQAYNTARCWPTRGALLTGFYAQHIRRDVFPDEPAGAGTKGVRPGWARLLPALLKQAGYATYHSGKWHVDGTPQEGGFDRSYTLLDQDRYFSPKNHAIDGEKLPPAPADFYATTAIADRAIEFLKAHAAQTPKKPFFSFVAFTSPHFPLHAPVEDIEKYKGRYGEGADALREARLQRLWEKGMLFNAELPEPAPPAKDWLALSEAERAAFAMRMEVHAAMVDRMDREIGRILEELRSTGSLDNTVVLFLSDNGASAESLVRGDGNQQGASPGSAQSYLCLEAQGASLANTPLRFSKMFVHEGGISTPLVVRWPVGIKGRGELREQPVHVVDIAPTLLKLAGVPWPKKMGEQSVPSSDGVDISGVIRENKSLSNRPLWWSHEGHRAFRLGDWKWVALKGKPAELYYLKGDRAESRDLAAANPERLGEMEAQWNRMTSKMREESQSPDQRVEPPRLTQ
jgi:arylsulfatase A-like enzyme